MVRKRKLLNVGDVVVEDDTIELAPHAPAYAGVETGETAVFDPADAPEAPPAAPASEAPELAFAHPSTNSGEDEDPEEETPEDLSNISEKDRIRQLTRERNALLKSVSKIGVEYGAGKTSMISLAETVTEAAMHGAIGPTDAEEIYDKFRESADKRATLDDAGVVPDAALSEKPSDVDPVKSKKQQLTKLRRFIILGNTFEDDAATVVRTARNVHLRMLDGDRAALKKGSTYSILVDIAREQLTDARKGVPMTEGDIETFLTVDVAEKAPPDGIKKIEDALNSARAAQRGGKERAAIANDDLDRAIDHLRAALGALSPERLIALDAKHAKGEEKDVATVTEPTA
jgi:hypothetical protein